MSFNHQHVNYSPCSIQSKVCNNLALPMVVLMYRRSFICCSRRAPDSRSTRHDGGPTTGPCAPGQLGTRRYKILRAGTPLYIAITYFYGTPHFFAHGPPSSEHSHYATVTWKQTYSQTLSPSVHSQKCNISTPHMTPRSIHSHGHRLASSLSTCSRTPHTPGPPRVSEFFDMFRACQHAERGSADALLYTASVGALACLASRRFWAC